MLIAGFRFWALRKYNLRISQGFPSMWFSELAIMFVVWFLRHNIPSRTISQSSNQPDEMLEGKDEAVKNDLVGMQELMILSVMLFWPSKIGSKHSLSFFIIRLFATLLSSIPVGCIPLWWNCICGLLRNASGWSTTYQSKILPRDLFVVCLFLPCHHISAS